MASQNNFAGKFQEGTFSNGEGPIHGIEISHEQELKGVLGGTDMKKNLSVMGGSGTDGLDGRAEETGFDIYGSSYKGPQNWKPDNKGVTPNYEVNKGK